VIGWERRGHVAVATIDRQERRNALDAEHCDALRAHLEDEPELRAVVLTGAGTAFCAGADLGTRFGETAEDTFRPAFDRLLNGITDYPAPVIAAVDGPALGAGCQLAIACDLRIAGPDATFGIPAAKLGVFLSPANVARLVALVGPGPARDLLMTARTLDVHEAEAIGLLTRTADDALVAALALAEEIAELAPLTIAAAKRAVDRITSQLLAADVVSELAALEERAMTSADVREGVSAFAEKRRPRFEGR
jgi:enoyl-CoA hydratase